jgi:hypothetical protein
LINYHKVYFDIYYLFDKNTLLRCDILHVQSNDLNKLVLSEQTGLRTFEACDTNTIVRNKKEKKKKYCNVKYVCNNANKINKQNILSNTYCKSDFSNQNLTNKVVILLLKQFVLIVPCSVY